MASEATIDRGSGALEAIGDSYPKYVVSMDPVAVGRNGITRLRPIGFLSDESLRRLGFVHWALIHCLRPCNLKMSLARLTLCNDKIS